MVGFDARFQVCGVLSASFFEAFVYFFRCEGLRFVDEYFLKEARYQIDLEIGCDAG